MFNRDPLANPEPLIRRVYAYVAYFVGDGTDDGSAGVTFEKCTKGPVISARQCNTSLRIAAGV